MMKYNGLREPAHRLAGVTTVLATTLALVVCSARPPSDSHPLVLTTLTIMKDMAKSIVGDRLRVEPTTLPGGEIHDHQPSPGDIRHGADADLITQNGLDLERRFKKFTSQSGIEIVVVSKGVTPIPIAEGDHKDGPNLYVWTNPKNAKIYVDNMTVAFPKLDPSYAEEFRANGEAYKAKLDATADDIQEKFTPVPQGQQALMTCEGVSNYLTRDYGFAEYYLWDVNAEGVVTPKRAAAVQGSVEKNRILIVFYGSTVEGKMDTVAQATGTKYGGTLCVDPFTDTKGPAPTYLKLFGYDAKAIVPGLVGRAS